MATYLQTSYGIQTKLEQSSLIIIDTQIENSSKICFDSVLLETLDEVFSSLGEVCKQAIYRQLNEKYRISKQAIPNNIKEFTNAMEEIFGRGSIFLETKIMRLLYNKVQDFKYYRENEELSFSSYLENLQIHLLV